MPNKGFSHIGLSTLDLDKTQDFYENVLGFKSVRCDIIKIKEGGRVRHMFFDLGHGQLIAFMEQGCGCDTSRLRCRYQRRARRPGAVLSLRI